MAKHHELVEPNAVHPAAFVGAVDPATVPSNNVTAEKLWIDTTLPAPYILKKRDATNTFWEVVGGGTGSGSGTLPGPPGLDAEEPEMPYIIPGPPGGVGATGAAGAGADGWTADATAWAFGAADAPSYTMTVAGDVTTTYAVGMKIRLTHSATVKYFIVTAINFGGGSTTITLYGGTTYTLAAGAISAVSYSVARAPYGFPLDPDAWTVETSDTSAATQSTPVSGTWYNLGTITIVIPIGLWNVSYEVWLQSNSIAAQTSVSQYCSLSTANNSESDTAMTSWVILGSASATLTLGDTSTKSRIFTMASKTTHYLVSKTIHANNNNINFRGDISPTKIRARCAYL